MKNSTLSSNGLETLPDEIARLTRLRCLDVSGNDLDTLTENMRRLPELERIFLHGNPRLGLPNEILGPTCFSVETESLRPRPAPEILDYYFASRGAEGQQLREVKLIFVGRGHVGKDLAHQAALR